MEKQHAEKCASHKIISQCRCPDPNHGKTTYGECDCDSYHTFDELYEHRFTLFIILCREVKLNDNLTDSYGDEGHAAPGRVWRSKLHYDGTMYDDQFILGIGKDRGDQITYHLPLSKWDETDFAETLDKAPPFDGHTPDDVLERLKNL